MLRCIILGMAGTSVSNPLLHHLCYENAVAEASGDVDVSLVTCAYNAESRLEAYFQRLRALRPSCSWEVILIDNRSTDATQNMMSTFARDMRVPVRVVYAGQKGSGIGRNAGIIYARGCVFSFIDDDCYADTHLLDVAHRIFQDMSVGFAGGRILLHDPQDYPLTINTQMEPEVWTQDKPLRPGMIQGANMMMRAEALRAVGGFDPDFGAGAPFSGEELDVIVRLQAAGWIGQHEPDAIVHHHHRRKQAEAWRLNIQYQRGCGASYAKLLRTMHPRWPVLRNWLGWQKYYMQTGKFLDVTMQWCGFFAYLRRSRG